MLHTAALLLQVVWLRQRPLHFRTGHSARCKIGCQWPRRHGLQQAASSEIVSRYRHINDDQKQSMRVWTVLRIHCARLVRLRKKPLTSAFSKRIHGNLQFIAGLRLWQIQTVGTQWRRRLCSTASRRRRRAFLRPRGLVGQRHHLRL